MMDCAEVHELAPEMALGSLDGAVRADVLAHMARCAMCCAEVRDLSEVVDGLATLAPAVDPPSGLTDRVLDAIRVESPAPPPVPIGRRRWRTRDIVVAAIAAAVLGIVGTATVVAVRDAHHASSNQVALNARDLTVAPMIGASDQSVGDAYISRGASPWVLVNVSYGLHGDGYRLVGVTANGAVVDIGPMRTNGDQLAWAGRVDQVPSLVELRIVDGNGWVACRAQLA
jgi:hypothetical protein